MNVLDYTKKKTTARCTSREEDEREPFRSNSNSSNNSGTIAPTTTKIQKGENDSCSSSSTAAAATTTTTKETLRKITSHRRSDHENSHLMFSFSALGREKEEGVGHLRQRFNKEGIKVTHRNSEKKRITLSVFV